MKKLSFIFSLGLFLLICPNLTAQSLKEMKHLYTQVNLHPDEQRARLYAANFLQKGLIPAGTEVEFVSLSDRVFEFKVKSTGKLYYYHNHKQANEDFEAHLKRFFGPSWDPEKVTSLSEIDMKGIREGKALKGMTRDGVIIALGYPPRLENPDLKAVQWRYWKSRFDRIAITFGTDGLVSQVKD